VTNWDRIEAAFACKPVDRIPILDGWTTSEEHMASLAGVTIDDYWDDTEGVSLKAYRKLGTDGLVAISAPRERGSWMITDYFRANVVEVRDIPEFVESFPTADEVERETERTFEERYTEYRHGLVEKQMKCRDIVWMPANLQAGVEIAHYDIFGYEAWAVMFAQYPDSARRWIDYRAAMGRREGELIAKAVEEGLLPHGVLIGDDICGNRGPLIDPAFLEKYWMGPLTYALEPLLHVGCKPIWHCCGNVNPIVDMLLSCGVKGFQGFQRECGVKYEELIEKRTSEGEKLVILGPLSIVEHLQTLTADEIYEEYQTAILACMTRRVLYCFTPRGHSYLWGTL